MSRIDWASNPHTFETGLDRGVLYPKKVKQGPLVSTNYAYDTAPVDYHQSNLGGLTKGRWFGSGGGAGTYSLVDGPAPNGRSRFARKTWTALNTPASTAGDAGFELSYPAGAFSVQEGDTIYVGWWARFSVAGLVLGTSIYCVGGSNPRVHSVTKTLTDTNWNWVVFSVKVPAGVTSISSTPLDIRNAAGPIAAGSTYDVCGAMVSKNVPILGPEDWFDGNKASDEFDYEWSGAANASTALKRQIVGTGVPWSGLISVEESGQDNAVTYYMDGRPFLHYPQPKEFEANIKAYTYPDEFAELMGLLEVADGMYLDSQQSDSFDLSYRTLIGSNLGEATGYKIHLVYNATVTSDNTSYESLSDSMNPTEFSWNINAVPAHLEGFRATAHIVIDTRHMEDERIYRLEALLYGTTVSPPRLPQPSEIYDLLNFGEAIIVTLSDDGMTFTVESSYENLYMVDDGIWQLENVNATFGDGGIGDTVDPNFPSDDGTFTISSTNAD